MPNPFQTPRAETALYSQSPVSAPRFFLAVHAKTALGSFVALSLGMFACWIRLGWLSRQWSLPMESWRLPMYFWFHFGCWVASAYLIALLTLPFYFWLSRSVEIGKIAPAVCCLCVIATVGFESLKPYEMIEPPTHAVIVLATNLVVLIPLGLYQRVQRVARGCSRITNSQSIHTQ